MVQECHNFALVLPTLNEAGNIALALKRAITALSHANIPWEIIVVDDGSTDGTLDIVRQYMHTESHVRLITRQGQRGLAGAITHGWAQTDAELLGVMDADLQHPPELLVDLIAEIHKGPDIVIASRYLLPNSMDGWNPLRRLVSRLGVLASKPVQRASIRINDPLSGFFVVRRACIAGLHFQPAGFKLLLEILARGRIHSAKEIPFKFDVRRSGNSKTNVMIIVHYLSLLFKLFLHSDRDRDA